VDQFRKQRVASPELPKYEFEDTTLYETHRGALRFMRRLLHPILKLFINPNPLIHAMHVQAQVNDEIHKRFRQREEMDPLYYEVVHNLVMEVTRLGIDVHNMKMRVESLSSRLDFNERRGRSLESVVEYRPGTGVAGPGPSPASGGGRQDRGENNRGQGGRPPGTRPDVGRPEGAPQEGAAVANGRGDAEGERRRRRRRRRRRPGQTFAEQQSGGQSSGESERGDPEDAPESSREKMDAVEAGTWASEGGPPSPDPDSRPGFSEPGPSGRHGQAQPEPAEGRPFDDVQGRPEPVEGRARNHDDGDPNQ
jgi:hypothetical protein